MRARKNEENKRALIQNLNSAYVMPGHPIAFSGVNNIYRYFKGKLSPKEIKNEIYKKLSYSIHKETKKSVRNPFFIYRKRQQFQMDTLEISQYAKDNDGYKYLLMCIDVFTRKAFVRPLKSKHATEILSQFKSILSESKQPPQSVFSDKGSEIKNKTFMKFCEENNIKVMHAENEVHGPHVERFNRTFQSLIYKYLTDKDTSRYIDVLQKLVLTYNSKYHRSIKMSPNEAELKKNQKKLFQIKNVDIFKFGEKHGKNREPKFEIGDYVRVKFWKSRFSRSYNEQFTEEIFRIYEIERNMPIITYKLQDLNRDPISGTWYENELSKTEEQFVFKIEKILKSRTLRGKKQQLIKWRSYPASFNSWVNESDLEEV